MVDAEGITTPYNLLLGLMVTRTNDGRLVYWAFIWHQGNA